MFTEKSDCKGVGLPKNQYIGGNCLKKGGGQFPDFQGGLGKKEKGGGGLFLRKRVDTLMHTMTIQMLFCKIPNPKNMLTEVLLLSQLFNFLGVA